MNRIGQLIATLFGPLADRIADRIADRLDAKLPDLSDLDDQIVAKLPDLSNLPQQVAAAVTAVIGSLGKIDFIPGAGVPLSSIEGGIDVLKDGFAKFIEGLIGKGKP